MDTSLVTVLGLGLLLGLRHALDADHVAAVSVLVSQQRGLLRSCLLGAFWGAGHTAALLGAGVAVLMFRVTISPQVERALETAVGALLVLLGGHVLLRTLGSWVLHRHQHSHDGEPHSHVHLHLRGAEEGSHGHAHLLRVGRRPFLVGMLHGLAGSAALMLLVLTTIPSAAGGLLYILVFGVGSTGGMLLLSGLIGIPFAVRSRRSRALHTTIQMLASATSLILGLVLMWELGRV